MRRTNAVFLGDAALTLPYDLHCRKLVVTAHQTKEDGSAIIKVFERMVGVTIGGDD